MYSLYLGYCFTHHSLLFKLNSFFSLALLSPGIHLTEAKKKLANNYMQIKLFFKDVIYLFWCHGYLKRFVENYKFVKNLETTHTVGVVRSCYFASL